MRPTLVSFAVQCERPASRFERGEIEFRGTKGTLYLKSTGYEVVADKISPNEFFARTPLDRSQDHWQRGRTTDRSEERSRRCRHKTSRAQLPRLREDRKETNCDIEVGHRSTSAPLIGNIAYKMKAFLEWDAKAERFFNNDAANKMLSYKYRAPYKL